MDFDLLSGLVYSRTDQETRLDLYLPLGAAEPVPCIIVIQGGGFIAQDGKRFRPFAEHLATHGLAAALIEYRGRPDHTYRDTIADTKAAVRFVRTVAAEHGIDPTRIGAVGRSAGATLVALLAVSGDLAAFESDSHEYGGVSCAIQAAVGIAGVYDFVARFTDAAEISLQPNVDTKIATNGEWIGSPFASTDKDWLMASAIQHLHTAVPPMLLLHSTNDATVPWLQSQRMHDAMLAAGKHSELELSDEGGHGGPATTMTSMVQFFRKVL